MISMLGDFWHERFRSETLNFSDSKKLEWEKLLILLQDELKLREKLVLEQKTAQLLGIIVEQGIKERDKIKPYKGNYMSEYNRLKCAFCDQGNHIVITTAKGNKIIPYVCEAFVNRSPAEKCAKLKSKDLCTTSVYPGAVNGENHKCFFLKFYCPHPSHGDGKNSMFCYVKYIKGRVRI